MKRLLAVLVTVLLTFGLVAVAAQPASAYTKKQNRVWTFVKSQSPMMAKVIGKRQTVQVAKLTCRTLDTPGVTIYDIVDAIISSADGMSSDAEDMYYEYASSTTSAAITFLCPRHQWQLDDL